MAKCRECGAKVGFMDVACDACLEKQREGERARLKESAATERALVQAGREAVAAYDQYVTRMTTTTLDVAGFRVVESVGLVRGLSVRSRGLFGQTVAQLQMDIGGEISALSKMCEQTRSEALQRMWVHATELGANAVIGFRYDTNEIAAGVAEVLCYGTAVRVEAV